MTDRLKWVDIAKALSITLVVMMHTAYGVGAATGETGYLHWVIGFAAPFRMPEFFLISGLFLSYVIARDWRHYADRRVVHYFYFYGLWALILCGIKCGLLEGRPDMMLHNLSIAIYQPYSILWFIYMLAVFSAVAKLAFELKIPHWVMLGVGALLQVAPIHTGWYAIDQFAEHLVYFYLGYAAAPLVFKLVSWAQAHLHLAMAGLVAWAAINAALVFSPGFQLTPDAMQMGLAGTPGLRLALAIAGSLALCVMSGLLARLNIMNWLAWVGERSLAIYLAFSIPMAVSRVILVRFVPELGTGAISSIVLAIAMVSPLFLLVLIEKTGWGRFLFERPIWASIHHTGSRTQKRQPAE